MAQHTSNLLHATPELYDSFSCNVGEIRPQFVICWITLYLGEFQSTAIEEKIKIKIEPKPKLYKIVAPL